MAYHSTINYNISISKLKLIFLVTPESYFIGLKAVFWSKILEMFPHDIKISLREIRFNPCNIKLS